MRAAPLVAAPLAAIALTFALAACAGTPPGQTANATHRGYEEAPIGSRIGGTDAMGPTGDANSPGVISRSNQIKGN